MAQNDNNISGALIGWIIAILFILFAIAISGSDWNPTTGNTGPVQGNCNDAAGLGC